MGYAHERSWHGLSCACGGGYRVGHVIGCEYATAHDNLRQIESDLARAVTHGDHAEAVDLRRIRDGIEAVAARSATGG